MAETYVLVGSYGSYLYCNVALVRQEQANWRSLIGVTISMYNGGTVTSKNLNNVTDFAINGDAAWSITNGNFSVPAKTKVAVYYVEFWLTHDANGNLTADFTAYLGATGTTTFGSGGTTPTASQAIPSLATVPGAPSAVVPSLVDSTSAYCVFTDNANNGGIAVSARRLYYSVTNNSATAGFMVTDGSDTLPGLAPKTLYYVWGRTYNTIGWSAFSPVAYFTTLAKPEPPVAPAVSNVGQTSLDYAFTDGADNGAAITAREIAYSLTIGGAKTSKASGVSGTLTSLPPGVPLYIWARTYNAIGWSDWSLSTLTKTLAGMWVRDSTGTPKEAVPYLNVGGVWKLLEPYVRSSGIWRKTG